VPLKKHAAAPGLPAAPLEGLGGEGAGLGPALPVAPLEGLGGEGAGLGPARLIGACYRALCLCERRDES
jgi:hypothetical protein